MNHDAPAQTPPSQTPPARKGRHDGFDGRRKRKFLDVLAKCGCVRDAARAAEVSPQTVYNHQRSDPGFAHQCELALDMAGTDVELHAWERGVTGIKEPVFDRAGEVVGYRIKRSDNILRLLLQGANRKKYGPNPGFSRKRLTKLERKRIEQEVRDEWEGRHVVPIEEVTSELEKHIERLAKQLGRERLARAWATGGDGRAVSPDQTRAPGWAVLAEPDGRGETVGGSV